MNLDGVSSPLAPGVPEALTCVLVPLAVAGTIAALVWSLRLDYRYQRPYALLRATSDEKWRWAATAGFWQAAMFPLLGMIAPLVSPLSGQWPMIPICTGAGILIFFPFFTVAKRLSFEWHLQMLRSSSRSIRSGRLGATMGLVRRPSLWLIGLFDAEGLEEHKRFWIEGFPE